MSGLPWLGCLPTRAQELLALEGCLVGNSKFLTALTAAAGQHPATIGRGHAFTESVLVLTLALGGLVGTFHIASILKGCKSAEENRILQQWAKPWPYYAKNR